MTELVSRTEVISEERLATDYPQGRPARLTVELANGEKFVEFQEVPYGDATRPMDDGAVEQKFLANVVDVIGTARAAAIIETVGRLERLTHITELTRLLGVA